MSEEQSQLTDVDSTSLAWGVIFGVIVGGLVTLFTAPKRTIVNRKQISQITRDVRSRLETAVPTPIDPVEESLAEGKAAARRRREELGRAKPS